MRISRVKLVDFRRFSDLEIRDIPEAAKLVVLAGPNGTGKSSLFDAFLVRYRLDAGYGTGGDDGYYRRPNPKDEQYWKDVTIETHNEETFDRGSVYVRTAYRNEPSFTSDIIERQGGMLDSLTTSRMIEGDATVSRNYQRLAAQAMEDLFVKESASTTVGSYRDKLIGKVREPLARLFPGLEFIGVGNPLDRGCFQFNKGATRGFDYKNLSGGEKAAFDLILDFVIKGEKYQDAIYCIDEPETHMNTRLQGALLGELMALLPGDSQLWIASHSIGMMRKAREIYDANPASVAFIDFAGQDFDQPVVLRPSRPSRTFWEGVMNVALDDLAALIAPSHVVICEGNPRGLVAGKNAEHDARIYKEIFSEDMPDVTFISAGNSKEVQSDFIGLATVLPSVAAGMKVSRLIDLDDHSPQDVEDLRSQGVRVLGRRHIECFLYDDEVLTALCASVGKENLADELIAAKRAAMQEVRERGFPDDDVKKGAGTIYNAAKRLLNLSQVGNDAQAFGRQTLAKLIRPGMKVYEELKCDVFGC